MNELMKRYLHLLELQHTAQVLGMSNDYFASKADEMDILWFGFTPEQQDKIEEEYALLKERWDKPLPPGTHPDMIDTDPHTDGSVRKLA